MKEVACSNGEKHDRRSSAEPSQVGVATLYALP